METVHNKLVRDKIPEIIIKDNRKPYVRVLNDEEYKKALEDKLLEECKEVINSNGKERIEELETVEKDYGRVRKIFGPERVDSLVREMKEMERQQAEMEKERQRMMIRKQRGER